MKKSRFSEAQIIGVLREQVLHSVFGVEDLEANPYRQLELVWSRRADPM